MPAAAAAARGVRPSVLIAAGVALLLAGIDIAQQIARHDNVQLDLAIASAETFSQEKPRLAQLVVLQADGTGEKLESRRYGSAFIDQRTTFRFEIRDANFQQLLVSPTAATGEHHMALRGLSLRRSNQREKIAIPFERVSPQQHVEVIDRRADAMLLRVTGAGVPLLSLNVDGILPPAEPLPLMRGVGRAALLGAVVFGLGCLLAGARAEWRSIHPGVGAALLAATALVLTMALLSRFNAHPDEYLHFESANYFSTQLLPPPLNSPEVEPSFSHYGFSYLQDLDTAYVAAGRLMAAIPEWLAGPETAARLFNALLFAVVAFWIAARLHTSLAPAVLLISPQIWYVFSYVNADAWPLALGFLVVVQLADNTSALNRYLEAPRLASALSGAIGCAVLLALLLMAKRNFYLLFPFVAWVALWSRKSLAKWAVVAALAAAMYLPLRIGHEALNGFKRPAIQTQQAEQFAAEGFRPSDAAAGKTGGGLNLRGRGISFDQMLFEIGWIEKSFQSFCGTYRWMTLPSPAAYYWIMAILYAALAAMLFVRVCSLSWRDAIFAAGILGLMAAMVAISAYHSWTGDFQPQGRYLFPILPMAAFLFHQYRESLRSRAFKLLFMALFAGSVFSFAWTGVRHIPQ